MVAVSKTICRTASHHTQSTARGKRRMPVPSTIGLLRCCSTQCVRTSASSQACAHGGDGDDPVPRSFANAMSLETPCSARAPKKICISQRRRASGTSPPSFTHVACPVFEHLAAGITCAVTRLVGAHISVVVVMFVAKITQNQASSPARGFNCSSYQCVFEPFSFTLLPTQSCWISILTPAPHNVPARVRLVQEAPATPTVLGINFWLTINTGKKDKTSESWNTAVVDWVESGGVQQFTPWTSLVCVSSPNAFICVSSVAPPKH